MIDVAKVIKNLTKGVIDPNPASGSDKNGLQGHTIMTNIPQNSPSATVSKYFIIHRFRIFKY